jgi:hypothetical protein
MAPRMPIGWTDFSQQPQQPQGGFVWGAGGAQKTPEQMARDRALTDAMMKSDYSPVRSAWQGLGRVADQLLGAVESRKLDKQEAAAADRNASLTQALLSGQKGVAGQAIADPYVSPEVQKLAGMVYERENPKPLAPTDLQSNYNWLTGMGRGDDANNLIGRATQNVQWITADNGDGTKSIIPIGPNGPMQGGGGPASTGQAAPPQTLPPDFDFGAGGPTQPASGGFPR